MNWIGMAVGAGAGAGVVAVLISAGIMKMLGKNNSKLEIVKLMDNRAL
jgi:hypothetical protein